MKKLVILIAVGLGLSCAALDIDTGLDAIGLAKAIAAKSQEQGAKGEVSFDKGWVRLRGVGEPQPKPETGNLKPEDKVQETREALGKLRERGLRMCVMLRWQGKSREQGTGSMEQASSGRSYLPEDLREAYERGRVLGVVYGDLVDAWEVDNEPDLGAVPEAAERYAAYLKASWLGLKAGSRERGAGRNEAKVVMGALGLPPGPWLERFAANDGFAYTDGFNYHYYGYADDFTAVYRQHKAAVAELSAIRLRQAPARQEGQEQGAAASNGPADSMLHAPCSVQKNLPIFLTEVGYGMLGKTARDTKEGRLRQWRWFKSVGEQVALLRPEAPMAFYLPPYLEYDTLEFGLTVPAKQGTEKPEGWIAGGIKYTAADFGLTTDYTDGTDGWTQLIGQQIAGNEITPALAQWLSRRAGSKAQGSASAEAPARQGQKSVRPDNPQPTTNNSGESRSWTVTASATSPVVLDFLPGAGLSFVKRYNGSFVTGTVTSREQGAGSKEPEGAKPDNQQPTTDNPPPRREELMLHVRTANGNLYEVYPTRMATPEWQSYMEPQGNFTMSFYGRAELPWRLKDNRPASLVVVMYPKQLPATYEFRRVQLLKLGAGSLEQGAGKQSGSDPSTLNAQLSTAAQSRYGRGKMVLYNFSENTVSGRLVLPETMEQGAGSREHGALAASSVLKLLPNERCEIPVVVKVPWGRYERIEAPVSFVPDDASIPPAHFATGFIPDIGGMETTVVASLTSHLTTDGDGRVGRVAPNAPSNRALIISRQRATEEAPMFEQGARSREQGANNQQRAADNLPSVFFQQGAKVGLTPDGFVVTVTATPPGKPQRIEVEIPWPDGVEFGAQEFLSLDFRLGEKR